MTNLTEDLRFYDTAKRLMEDKTMNSRDKLDAHLLAQEIVKIINESATNIRLFLRNLKIANYAQRLADFYAARPSRTNYLEASLSLANAAEKRVQKFWEKLSELGINKEDGLRIMDIAEGLVGGELKISISNSEGFIFEDTVNLSDSMMRHGTMVVATEILKCIEKLIGSSGKVSHITLEFTAGDTDPLVVQDWLEARNIQLQDLELEDGDTNAAVQYHELKEAGIRVEGAYLHENHPPVIVGRLGRFEFRRENDFWCVCYGEERLPREMVMELISDKYVYESMCREKIDGLPDPHFLNPNQLYFMCPEIRITSQRALNAFAEVIDFFTYVKKNSGRKK